MLLLSLVLACGGPGAPLDTGAAVGGFTWDLLTPGLPEPVVPEDNPMTTEKVELGRHLFYDTRLSVDETMSCASCHEQALAFTDGEAVGVGVTGEAHVRGAMSLVNVAYASTLNWANPTVRTLELQAMTPLFGDQPVEMGMTGKEQELLDRLEAEPVYGELFPAAFPDREAVDLQSVVQAIAAFQRSIISTNAPYDRYTYDGDTDALSDSALRGRDLFFSEELECFHCHGGWNLSDATLCHTDVFDSTPFHNTGLYNIDGEGGFPDGNRGVIEITGIDSDMGRFRAPSLRNIALTAPYMHDGSIETLDGVLDHYAAGGRTIEDGPHAGVGADNPYKSGFVSGFELSQRDRADLLAFLDALTDPVVTTDPRFSDPW